MAVILEISGLPAAHGPQAMISTGAPYWDFAVCSVTRVRFASNPDVAVRREW
jgi:hypothetical protein